MCREGEKEIFEGRYIPQHPLQKCMEKKIDKEKPARREETWRTMDKESTSKQEVTQQPRQKDFPILAPKDYMICYEAGHTACLPFSLSKGKFFL